MFKRNPKVPKFMTGVDLVRNSCAERSPNGMVMIFAADEIRLAADCSTGFRSTQRQLSQINEP
jgi:hypothetical protein